MRRIVLALGLSALAYYALAQAPAGPGIDELVARGDALFSQGQIDAAARSFDQARHVAIESKSAAGEASALIGAALALQAKGNFSEARERLNEAMAKAAEAGRRDLQVRVLVNLASIEALRGDTSAAFEGFVHAAGAARAAGLADVEARAVLNAARAQQTPGDPSRGAPQIARAQALLPSLTASRDAAYLWIALGDLQRTRNPAAAREALLTALGIAEAIGDERARSHALGTLGQVYAAQARGREAAGLLERAIASAQREGDHASLYRWHWELGRVRNAAGDAPGALTAYRAAVRHLQDVRNDIAANISGSALSFREVLGPLFYELADLLLVRSAALSEGDERQGLLREARATIELSKAAELEDYFSDGCVTAARRRIGELEQLAVHTAVIYPIMLRDRLELLVSHAARMEQITVGVGAQQLTDEIRAFRDRLERRMTRQYLVGAQRLYKLIFEPLETLLARLGSGTLVVVPDGPMRTIPFAALHDGRQFLVSRFAFATTPGITLTDPQPLAERKLSVLVNALTVPVQGFSALPSVEAELLAIRDGYEVLVLRDQAFQVASVEKEIATRPYTIVHIASHAQFDRDPRQTFLLAYDGKISMDGLEKMIAPTRRREGAVELLALSACQTAAGDDRAALGLAGVAIKAGVRSALASLWFINDDASSQLVAHFYAELRRPGVSKAQALQHAQVELMRDSRYSHPAYWAPFLLIGNWL